MKNKGVKISFMALMAISFIILLILSLKTNSLIHDASSASEIAENFSSLQKSIGLINITSFIVLLIISLINFFLNNSKNYIFIANIYFIVFTLNNYVSMSKDYFNLSENNIYENGNYWLMTLIAIFYIMGGILVSAIGYITVRNFVNRNTKNEEIKIQQNGKIKFR